MPPRSSPPPSCQSGAGGQPPAHAPAARTAHMATDTWRLHTAHRQADRGPYVLNPLLGSTLLPKAGEPVLTDGCVLVSSLGLQTENCHACFFLDPERGTAMLNCRTKTVTHAKLKPTCPDSVRSRTTHSLCEGMCCPSCMYTCKSSNAPAL